MFDDGVPQAPTTTPPDVRPTQYPVVLVNGIDVSPAFRYSDRILAVMRELGGHDVHLAIVPPYETPPPVRAAVLWERVQEIRDRDGSGQGQPRLPLAGRPGLSVSGQPRRTALGRAGLGVRDPGQRRLGDHRLDRSPRDAGRRRRPRLPPQRGAFRGHRCLRHLPRRVVHRRGARGGSASATRSPR